MKNNHKASAFPLLLKDIQKIIHATTSFRDRTLIKSLFWIGLRREEATKADIRDVDFERKRLKVRGKGGKIRIVPVINDELISDLQHLIGTRTEGPLFPGPNNKPLTPRMVNNITKEAGEAADVSNPNPNRKHINPHIFRHSIARYLKSQQFPTEWVQKFLGHALITTTADEYGTISLDEMQEIAEAKLT